MFSGGNLQNFSCEFPNRKSIFLKTLHHIPVSWNITYLYLFSLSIIFFGQKQPIKLQIFETFKLSSQNLSNSLCQFLNDKSIPLQIFHQSTVSLHITLPYIFSSCIFYIGQKDPMGVPILILSNVLMKISHISHIVFQITGQFFFKFCMTLLWH